MKSLCWLTVHKPRERVLKIPSVALLNTRNLKDLYPSLPIEGISKSRKDGPTPLTGVQLLSLHISLSRPGDEGKSRDPHFGPYIETVPRHFEFHPLWWMAMKQQGLASQLETSILDILPPSVSSALRAVHQRLQDDWDNVTASLVSDKASFLRV